MGPWILPVYCAHAFGNSVANALLFTKKEEVATTAEFVDLINKFFDCLNVGNYTEGRDNQTALKQPYRKSTDFRLEVYN